MATASYDYSAKWLAIFTKNHVEVFSFKSSTVAGVQFAEVEVLLAFSATLGISKRFLIK